MTPNPFTPSTPDPSTMFGGLGAAPAVTPVHKLPLPPETRQYRPIYRFGKYSLPPLPGTDTPVTAHRVTSRVGTLDDQSGLTRWKLRETVKGVAVDPTVLETIDLHAESRDLNHDLDAAIDSAQESAGMQRASETGTAIHAWLEAVERGQIGPEDVPQQFRPYTDAYIRELRRAGVRPVPEFVERIVVNTATGWAGTFDNIYELATGERVIGDKKTSKTTSFKLSALKFAQQLAVYADADYMLSADGETWEPMPPVSDAFAVIAHVPSDAPGKCSLETIDLEYGRRAVELTRQVLECRTNAPAGILRRWEVPTIETAVDTCNSAEDLARLWEKFAHVWTDDLTRRGQKRLSELTR